jgi:hypothetical protein
MKALTALFAILALGVFIIGQSSAPASQAPAGVATNHTHAPGTMNRIATLIPARPTRQYSTPPTAPIPIACKQWGAPCTSTSQCCEGYCTNAGGDGDNDETTGPKTCR